MTLAEAIAKANDLMDNNPRPYRAGFGSLYDNLTAQVITGAQRFATSWSPIVASTLVVLSDSSPATASNVDEETGEFEVDPVPVRTLQAAYHYKRFTDAGLEEIANNAWRRLGPTIGSIAAVPEGLYPAYFHYIKGEGYTALATRYAEQVDVSVGSRSEGRAVIADRYMRLAEQEFELGDRYRDAFYEKAGAALTPGVGRATMTVAPYTPRR